MPQGAIDDPGSSSSSSSSPAKDEDVPIDIVIVPNALGLSQIEAHPLLKLMLKDMENHAAAIARKIERKETRTFVVKNEIYQLLTFYVVFQGVVLTAVAQASTLKCRHWWAPFTLSLIASVMTFVGVYQKLETFRQVKDDFENERFNSSVNGLNFSLFCALFESLLYVSALQETWFRLLSLQASCEWPELLFLFYRLKTCSKLLVRAMQDAFSASYCWSL